MIRRLALTVGAAALLAVPATAVAAPKEKAPPKPQKQEGAPKATVTIDVGHLHGGKAQILDTVPVTGTVKPYVDGQHVEVDFFRNGKEVVKRQVKVQQGPNETGTFEASVVVKEGGKYAVCAKHVATAALGSDSTVRKSWTVSFPKLNPAECSPVVGAFKSHLAKMGYVSGSGECFSPRLGREVLAYRKVNGMDRTKKAGPGLLKAAFEGKGGYHVKYPEAGRTRRGAARQAGAGAGQGRQAVRDLPRLDRQALDADDHRPLRVLPPGTGDQLGGDGLLLLLAQRVRGPRLPRSAELRRQPRLRADLHRRPAADLRTASLRRVDFRLLTMCDSAHFGVLGRLCAEHTALPASLNCLVTHRQDRSG